MFIFLDMSQNNLTLSEEISWQKSWNIEISLQLLLFCYAMRISGKVSTVDGCTEWTSSEKKI